MGEIRENAVRLDEKRLLTVREFEVYASVGHNNAYKFIQMADCGIRLGKKILVDRKRFDQWVSEQLS